MVTWSEWMESDSQNSFYIANSLQEQEAMVPPRRDIRISLRKLSTCARLIPGPQHQITEFYGGEGHALESGILKLNAG